MGWPVRIFIIIFISYSGFSAYQWLCLDKPKGKESKVKHVYTQVFDSKRILQIVDNY